MVSALDNGVQTTGMTSYWNSLYAGFGPSPWGYDKGGWITEPILGVGQRTGRGYAFGEKEQEIIIPKSAINSGGRPPGAGVSMGGGSGGLTAEQTVELLVRALEGMQMVVRGSSMEDVIVGSLERARRRGRA
jgi:hypothetical protein